MTITGLSKERGNEIWDLLSYLYGWPNRKDGKGDDIVDKKEMKRIEQVRKDFIMGQRFEYRCTNCKNRLKTEEFIYGNVTVVQARPCEMCELQSAIKYYGEGYDEGYENGYGDR